MADTPPDSHQLKHVRIEGRRLAGEYGPPRLDMSGVSSGRNRTLHGQRLIQELATSVATARERLTARDAAVSFGRSGLYLEVAGAEGERLPDLTWSNKHIRMGAVRLSATGAEVGAVFVPLESIDFLSEQVRQYTEEDTPKGDPKHKPKIEPLETIRPGTVESLWTDQRPLPAANAQMWWECWTWRDRSENLAKAADWLNLRVSERRLSCRSPPPPCLAGGGPWSPGRAACRHGA